jgi:aldehyde:ferredoxin oxidoreductase
VRGQTGKRLLIDLGLQRARTEEIPAEDLDTYLGGRGLNGKYFFDRMGPNVAPSAPENLMAFAVGPLSGTFAPCSGWTSISTISPLSYPPRYAHASLPGHWGPQLKFAGFDQLIVGGKAEKPIYLSIEDGQVHFEEATHLRGKDTVETTVAIQEEKEDRNLEVLCIGPAGENLVLFANVTHRFSWTGDHIGLGHVFGSKNLKAIALRGDAPVSLHDPDRFLQICLSVRERIQRNPNAARLKEEGPFLCPKQKAGGFGIKNYNESSQPDLAEKWSTAYLTNYLYGKEGCFSCPIHCGRISEVNGNYFGGVHFESAWSLGPGIGIDDWEKTLLLHRVCQLQGLDPSSMGSLLSWLMEGHEKGIFSSQDLGQIPCRWGEEKAALQLMEWIAEKKGPGKILGQGSLRAATSLGKGLDHVSQLRGLDLPARDPRSSIEYALGRILFPVEWDYLQSLTGIPFSDSSPFSGESQHDCARREAVALEKRKIWADLNSLCPLIIARLPIVLTSDIEELLSAATGGERERLEGSAAVRNTMEIEKVLGQKFKAEGLEIDPLPLRLFRDSIEKSRFEKEVADYDSSDSL